MGDSSPELWRAGQAASSTLSPAQVHTSLTARFEQSPRRLDAALNAIPGSRPPWDSGVSVGLRTLDERSPKLKKETCMRKEARGRSPSQPPPRRARGDLPPGRDRPWIRVPPKGSQGFLPDMSPARGSRIRCTKERNRTKLNAVHATKYRCPSDATWYPDSVTRAPALAYAPRASHMPSERPS